LHSVTTKLQDRLDTQHIMVALKGFSVNTGGLDTTCEVTSAGSVNRVAAFVWSTASKYRPYWATGHRPQATGHRPHTSVLTDSVEATRSSLSVFSKGKK
jgi:hypothetical protein